MTLSTARRSPISDHPFANLDRVIGEEWRRRLYKEDERLATFKEPWTGQVIFPKKLGISIFSMAAHGFYYTGRDDRIRCIFCQIELYQFEPYDDIATEHLRYSPDCRFIRDHYATENVTSLSRYRINRDLDRARSGIFQTALHHLARDREIVNRNRLAVETTHLGVINMLQPQVEREKTKAMREIERIDREIFVHEYRRTSDPDEGRI